MPRFSTLFLAFLLVALALFGSVTRAQDTAAADGTATDGTTTDGTTTDGTDTGGDTSGDAASASPAAGSPAAGSAAASPTASSSVAPGNLNGPALDVSEPSGETVVKPGDKLIASWTLDTEGAWNPMTIQFMTGSNQQMKVLSTVGQNIDATTVSQYEFTVPDVNPYSKIYFLQFTSANGAPSWSTRFTITGADGSTTTPPNTEMVNNESVGWGDGALANGAAAGGPSVIGAASTSSAVRPTGYQGTGITLYTDKLTATGIPSDVSTHGVAAATVGALPGSSGALSLRPAAAVVAIVAAAAILA